MEKQQLIRTINNIFVDTLDNPAIVLEENTKADDIPEWDSLTHIQLVYAIEKYFKIRFTSSEIRNWKNIGELCDSIALKKFNRE